MVSQAASICKKCITPKPPRTHHCSVCDRCILGMDHHCPWLNNCVGYFNARYFYLYMVYMVVGVTFVIIGGVDIGYQVLWLNDTGICQHHGNYKPSIKKILRIKKNNLYFQVALYQTMILISLATRSG